MRSITRSIAFGLLAIVLTTPFLFMPPAYAGRAKQLHIFARGLDNAVYQLYWNGSRWSKEWRWLADHVYDAPVAVSHNGWLKLYVVGYDGTIYGVDGDGQNWNQWYDLPLTLVPGAQPYSLHSIEPPSALVTEGELYLFPVDSHYSLTLTNAVRINEYGFREEYPIASWVLGRAAPVNHGGKRFVFFRSWDYLLYWDTLDKGRPFWNWQYGGQYGGDLAYGPGAVSYKGQLHVFGVGFDQQLYRLTWDGSLWHYWQPLGGNIIDDPVPVVYKDTLHVFVRGADNEIWWQTFDGTTWSGWRWDQHLSFQTLSAPGVVSFTPNGD